jgi:hypothetical protein
VGGSSKTPSFNNPPVNINVYNVNASVRTYFTSPSRHTLRQSSLTRSCICFFAPLWYSTCPVSSPTNALPPHNHDSSSRASKSQMDISSD